MGLGDEAVGSSGTASSKTSFVSPSGHERRKRALAWLAARDPADQILVVGPHLDAVGDLLREAVAAGSAGAAFGWFRITPARLAAELAQTALLERNWAPIGRLGAQAVVARVVHRARAADQLGRYTAVAQTPGFVRAAAGVIEELRLDAVDPGAVAEVAPELHRLLLDYQRALEEAALADRAAVFALAVDQLPPAHPLLGLPLLWCDVGLQNAREEKLLAAVVARAPEALATVPAADERTLARLERVGFLPATDSPDHTPSSSSLERIQKHLFAELAPAEALLDDSVDLLSAPGESRECVEIARRLLAQARSGVPFDRMAVLLRSPEEYRPHLEEAFARARIPAHFARGAVRPDPAGRAFLALLTCAAHGLSARHFAEYLSLGEVPDAGDDGAPPVASLPGDTWVAPDEELLPGAVAAAVEEALGASDGEDEDADPRVPDPDQRPVTAGSLRAPRRWEQLLVEAAVIGGLDRWERRLDGLEAQLGRELAEVEDPQDSLALRMTRTLDELASLRGFALPLLSDLAALPEGGTWGEWLVALRALATRSLRHPERVLAVLSELGPMATVGPVDLAEVQRTLGPRLLELVVAASRQRYGQVYVAPAELARGKTFDVVCVPGLAEKLFPREIREEPILLDELRERLDAGLITNDERVRQERLALGIAVGAARRHLVLSYPRLDLEKSRPRVPSFYTLEALRAAEGRLPGFDELAARAETASDARIGWPAPRSPQEAIDEAEHDLALLESLLRLEPAQSVGTARFLLTANPHLGRALRFRARRWLRRWTPADGLVAPSAAAAEALRAHRLDARSYSATALEHYAACPYRFFLQALHRLSPRETPVAIDEMNPLQRGSFVHEVLFELFVGLRAKGLLPVTAARLAAARAELEAVAAEVAARFHDELKPAIERVWADGIVAVRADLGEWLRRLSEDDSGFVPEHFELAFGLSSRFGRDSGSRAEPAQLECGLRLRGSIDLVERDAAGRVRVTDYKTGKVRLKEGQVIAGGTILQPVLYALAAEKIFEGDTVVDGRLSHCTTAGGFEVRMVPLAQEARSSAAVLAEAVEAALADGFLPAYPKEGACRWCDYQVVCGPYEEQRTALKPPDPALAALGRLRELR